MGVTTTIKQAVITATNMVKYAILLLLAGCGGSVEECILDRAPKAETNDEARVVMAYCRSRYDRAEPGSGTAYDSGQDCLNDKGDGIKSPTAFTMTRIACNVLYNKSATGPYSQTDRPVQ